MSEPQRISFTVPGKPQPKGRPRFARGVVFTPKSTRDYERHVYAHANLARLAYEHRTRQQWPQGATFATTIAIYFPDARQRDADNVQKAIQDACNTLRFTKGPMKGHVKRLGLWRDDSLIKRSVQTVEIDRENPRVDVTVEVLT